MKAHANTPKRQANVINVPITPIPPDAVAKGNATVNPNTCASRNGVSAEPRLRQIPRATHTSAAPKIMNRVISTATPPTVATSDGPVTPWRTTVSSTPSALAISTAP